jgi:hypothetical protein
LFAAKSLVMRWRTSMAKLQSGDDRLDRRVAA